MSAKDNYQILEEAGLLNPKIELTEEQKEAIKNFSAKDIESLIDIKKTVNKYVRDKNKNVLFIFHHDTDIDQN
jgi:hypothetical protein